MILIANLPGFRLVGVSITMFKRVSQPPVNPALRDLERHDFWPGFIAALMGIALVFCGARHLTGVDNAAGSTAWEITLRLHWSRPWDQIESFMQRQANGETLAHCVLLELNGRVRRKGDSPALFFVSEQ